MLNLADAYNLSGQHQDASEAYNQTLALLAKPESIQQFSTKAQALAHLGKHTNAIKTLKEAEQKFSMTSKLHYAAAIIHTAANNDLAAIVEIDAAQSTGTGLIWFRFKWFKTLCKHAEFAAIVKKDKASICRD